MWFEWFSFFRSINKNWSISLMFNILFHWLKFTIHANVILYNYHSNISTYNEFCMECYYILWLPYIGRSCPWADVFVFVYCVCSYHKDRFTYVVCRWPHHNSLCPPSSLTPPVSWRDKLELECLFRNYQAVATNCLLV